MKNLINYLDDFTNEDIYEDMSKYCKRKKMGELNNYIKENHKQKVKKNKRQKY